MKRGNKSPPPAPARGDTQTKIISLERWWNFFETGGTGAAISVLYLCLVGTRFSAAFIV